MQVFAGGVSEVMLHLQLGLYSGSSARIGQRRHAKQALDTNGRVASAAASYAHRLMELEWHRPRRRDHDPR